jgi:hypothetical protein
VSGYVYKYQWMHMHRCISKIVQDTLVHFLMSTPAHVLHAGGCMHMQYIFLLSKLLSLMIEQKLSMHAYLRHWGAHSRCLCAGYSS